MSFYKTLLEQQGVQRSVAEIAAHILHEMVLGGVNDYAFQRNAEAASRVLKQAVSAFIETLVTPAGPRPVAPTKVLKLRG